MKNSLISTLDLLITIEQEKKTLREKELASLPEGSLCSIFRNGGPCFYRDLHGRKQGITRDLDLVYRLARKRYLKGLLREQQLGFTRLAGTLRGKKISGSKSARPGYVSGSSSSSASGRETLLRRYGESGLDILRITCTEEQYRWAKKNYRQNPVNPEERQYSTYSGILVRSKSEQTIANRLEIHGIPYRYEQEVTLDVSWMEEVTGASQGRYKRYYPDFLIRTAGGEVIVWEHLGRVDQAGYRKHNMEKICAYRQSGRCDDAHLILTFEADMRSQDTIDQLIAKRVLPYM